jgi:hypothetical protein
VEVARKDKVNQLDAIAWLMFEVTLDFATGITLCSVLPARATCQSLITTH